MTLRLTTWNINSVRLRIGLVERFLEKVQPDVLCLQETKVADPLFPAKAFEKFGYPHHAIAGQKGYHGVAILSRIPFTEIDKTNWCDMGDARHVRVKLNGEIELHNFYVPAGGDVPDPVENDKFAHKLAFLDEMRDWFAANREAERDKMILVGDLNVAPLENDVWSHKQLLKVVSHTPIEVEKLTAVQDSLDWIDSMRSFVPEPERLFTWWSYRSRDWRESNRGRRLDHVWVTPPLKDHLRSMQIHDEARSWEKPSDHAPVTVELNIAI